MNLGVEPGWKTLKTIIKNTFETMLKWLLPIFGGFFLLLTLLGSHFALPFVLLSLIPSIIYYLGVFLEKTCEQIQRRSILTYRNNQNQKILKDIELFFASNSSLSGLTLKFLDLASSGSSFRLDWFKKCRPLCADLSSSPFSSLIENFFGSSQGLQHLNNIFCQFLSKQIIPSLWTVLKLEPAENRLKILSLFSELKTEDTLAEELLPFSRDTHENVRLKAIEILGGLAGDYDQALEVTLDALTSTSRLIRLTAISQLSSVSIPSSRLGDVLKLASGLLLDTDQRVTDYALWLLYSHRNSITPSISKRIHIGLLFKRHRIEKRRYQTIQLLFQVLSNAPLHLLNSLLSELLAFYLETKSERIGMLVIKTLESASRNKLPLKCFNRREMLAFYVLFKKLGSKSAYENFNQILDHEALIGLNNSDLS